MLRFKSIISAMLLLFLGLSIISCGGNSGNKGGVLIFARSGDSVGLDPAREDDGESFYVADNVYETLVQFKAGSTALEPGLAESWEASANGLEYTFKLRKGVKFHDGTDFNADAVIYSLARQFKADHPQFKNGPWKYWGYMDMSNIIKDIVKVDDSTVKFILSKPEAPFISNLAMQFASIVSPTAAEKSGEEFKSNPVGTGPFKFVSWNKDDSIILERFDGYWGEKALLDRVIFKVIPDPTARYLALQKGEVDIIDFPSPGDIENIKKDANLKVVEQAGMNVGYLAMNINKKPFDNKFVRQAFNYAINKEDIIKAVYSGLGKPAKNPLPPDMWSYNDKVKDYKYDPAKAKELLKQAGLENGFEATIWAMPVSRPYNPNAKKVAEIIQSQLKEVGVKLNIISYDWGTYLDKIASGEHDTCLIGWTGDNGDPDNFLWILLSANAATDKNSSNYSFWKNADFTAKIKEAKEVADVKKRTKLYEDAQVIFHEEAPWVTLAHSIVVSPMKKTVEGFILYPTGKRYFKNVYIKK